jgi:alkylation response protein AidB-like acyl-CoA dehydrogenase
MSDGHASLRDAARTFFASHAAEFGAEARRGLTPDEDLALGRRWQATKYDAGFAGIAWPKDHGGQGRSLIERLIADEEEARFGFPNEYFGISLGMPIPIVLRHGPEGWKLDRAIAALRGEEIWCQLFSEPAAGSDLAGLRLKATRDGDDWILDGQKLWTSFGQYSDYGIIVTRSDPDVPKHKGLTYFWVDMKAPGVGVRPIKLAGGDSRVTETFFDAVRVPDSQRLGAIGGGFGVAMETLVIERYHAADPNGFGPKLELFVDLAKAIEVEGRPALSDGRVRQQIARAYAMRNGLAAIYARTVESLRQGLHPGPEGAVHKLVAVRSRQKLSEFAMDIQGMAGLANRDDHFQREDWGQSWINAPTGRIAGGADEMLLNTIAEKVLGLPQDHRPDKNVAFRDIP